MNFDEMVEMINNLKNIKGDDCMICHLPIDMEIENNMNKLECNHTYHTTCSEHLKKGNIITCPYCQKITRLHNKNMLKNIDNTCIPPMINCIKIKKLKKIKIKCTTIFKSGNKKGLECNKINCKRHKTKIVDPPIDTVLNSNGGDNNNTLLNSNGSDNNNTIVTTIDHLICKSIMKTGSKKGNVCGRYNCKIHNKNIEV